MTDNSKTTTTEKSDKVDFSTLSMRQICRIPSKKSSRKTKIVSKEPFNRYVDEECVGEISTEPSNEETASEVEKKRVVAKPRKSKKWDKQEILKLYTGIMKYGADFGLIELMFDDRTRKQIKAKFKAEERVRPNMIERALNAQQTMDAALLNETLDLITKQTPDENENEEQRKN
ncbi:hypothetical protein EIN_314460 [Entamoeba invadens IP1]|uniref:Myb-like domain-containing protein n=1 Tax=Entamoeba invadens IP1 TaxID=370355 RepID=A0A0A1TZA0_ENTIV|nr:hypothetical protein EIN_314460 [Entamoeba invadens IP1]ELP86907.1 hypothetical protein EIN_314460 [Entamoeba invadens IP1]|eukprot:XP_004253678.1 hypothetical protein EIN_314460 [Entamoeba invadens IP1]